MFAPWSIRNITGSGVTVGLSWVQSFGVGAAAVGSTISVYAVARLMMNLPAGMLADRYGRKPLLVWGPLVTAVGARQSFQSCQGPMGLCGPALLLLLHGTTLCLSQRAGSVMHSPGQSASLLTYAICGAARRGCGHYARARECWSALEEAESATEN